MGNVHVRPLCLVFDMLYLAHKGKGRQSHPISLSAPAPPFSLLLLARMIGLLKSSQADQSKNLACSVFWTSSERLACLRAHKLIRLQVQMNECTGAKSLFFYQPSQECCFEKKAFCDAWNPLVVLAWSCRD